MAFFSDPPSHSHDVPSDAASQHIVNISQILKMGRWEDWEDTLNTRVFNILACLINVFKLPCSHFKKKVLKKRELVSLECWEVRWESGRIG